VNASFWKNIDTATPVVVVYRGGNGALAIARTLGRLGVPVYLVAKRNASVPVQSSRYWRGRFWWDFSSPAEHTLAFLESVARAVGGKPLLLTLADWAAIFIEQHADALERHFVFPRAREPVIARLADKWTMFDLARRNGVPVPFTARPQTRDEAAAFARAAGFPIVVKAADPFASHVPAKAIVSGERELFEKFDRDAQLGPPNVILQEYIPGDARDVWMCNAYFTRDSQCRAIFTGRKLRQVDATGVASMAVCETNTDVAETTRRFMQGTGYAGCVGIGYRYDARDGQYKVLDVNPRVSGVFRLFCAPNGLDVVRACYLDLTKQDVPAYELAEGRKWMLEDDVFAARALGVGVMQWLRSLRGVRETQWFAPDDPLPGVRWLRAQIDERLRSRRDAAVPTERRTARSIPERAT
jgi:predicted ATP-grasp superfamily ATP-dependent carboligase